MLQAYTKCVLCPRGCQVNREADQMGVCRVSSKLKVARAALHFWEETCISGTNGSGAVFFSGCSMHCVFCQNREIANGIVGKEIEIHGKLFHRNITRLFNVYENKTDIYLIMEHAEKGSLFSIMKQKGPFNENDARKYFIQVISAVHFLHRNNVIHRDIKPENILVDSHSHKDNMNIKLIDFGLSKVNFPTETSNESCGTVSYSAPEIIEEIPYNTSIDIWSFGVMLYLFQFNQLPTQTKAFNRQILKLEQQLFFE